MATTTTAGDERAVRSDQDSGMVGRRAAVLPASATAALDARVKELAAAGQDVINLTSGEVSFNTPPPANAAAIQAIEVGFTRYTPVAGIAELRQAVSRWLESRHGIKYGPGQIVVSSGAKQALSCAFMALLDPGDEVLLPAPYWVSFPHMITLAGGVPVIVPAEPGCGFKRASDLGQCWFAGFGGGVSPVGCQRSASGCDLRIRERSGPRA